MKDGKVFKSRGESGFGGFGGFDKVDFLYTTKGRVGMLNNISKAK